MKGDFSRDTFDPRKHYRAVLLQQGRVQVDADWNEQQAIHAHLGESTARDLIGASGAPAEDPGFLIRVPVPDGKTVPAPDGKTLFIGAGHFFVDGILCENEIEQLPYAAQPDTPGAPDPVTLLKDANATTAIVYLDVWRRHLTTLDDPAMREKALGGPDTATRMKTVWQVKVLVIKPASSFSCGDAATEWDDLLATPSGMLHARAKRTVGAADPCILPPQAGYRRLENQLYRVEVHETGTLPPPGQPSTKQASFKWSRDNGAVVTAVESVSGKELTVRDLGPDEALGFASGQWVEITTETSELAGLPGQLLQIEKVNPAARTVNLTAAPAPPIDIRARPRLRRWDGERETVITRPVENDGFLALEDGVEVRFEPGKYRSGDYWLIPARTALDADTGQIEWPFDRAQPPRGVRHHYARLALLTRDPTTNTLTVSDCRNLFRSLTGVAALHVDSINWFNDDVLPPDSPTTPLTTPLTSPLIIFLDATPTRPDPLNPETVDEDTLIVTLEAPLPAAGGPPASGALVAVRLPGTITVTGNQIQWKLASGVVLAELLKGPPLERRVRVTLKGHAIWSEKDGRRRYLDGQAVGRPGVRRLRAPNGNTVPRTDLVLPSGSGMRASDFESWLFVQSVPAQIAPRPKLTGFTLVPPRLLAGATAQGTLTLDGPAPPAPPPLAVTLTTATPELLAEPLNPVAVPAGQAFATFALKTKPNVTGFVGVTAKLDGGESRSASLEITVVAVSISPSSGILFTGSTQRFTATITGSDNTAVTWSVQGGGSVTPAGIYTAPATEASVQVIAQSSADPSKSATATVNIRIKPKDTKETKDNKDKEKEKEKEKEGKEDKDRPEKRAVKDERNEADFIGPLHGGARVSTGGRRRAFIRPEERPELTPPPPKGRSGGRAQRRNGRAH